MYARATHPTMLAKIHSGQTNKEVIAWAKNELDGFTRQHTDDLSGLPRAAICDSEEGHPRTVDRMAFSAEGLTAGLLRFA
jgi:hypothetical protein